MPGWLQRGQGEAVQYVVGLVHDAFAERCRQTVWLMLPSLAPSDALPRIGADRKLPQGLFEPDAQYRDRLKTWRFPRGHRVRGNAYAAIEQASIALRGTEHTLVDARGKVSQVIDGVFTTTRGGAWDWDGAVFGATNWGRYWLVAKSTGSPWPSFDDGAWGPHVDADADQCLAGDGIHPGEIAAVRRIVAPGSSSWTPGGRRAIYLVIYFDGDAFPIPDGTWGSWENRDLEYAYEPLHPSVT